MSKKLDIHQEILLNFDKCHGLLKRFQTANLSKEDFLSSQIFILHEVMRRCQGDGLLSLVEYLVNVLRPEDSIRRIDTDGNLPLHILPQGFVPPATKSVVQSDQLAARRYLLQEYPESLTRTNHYGETPLIRAIHVDYNIFVQSYITEFPDDLLLFEKETSDKSHREVKPYHHPLHYAIECGNTEAVQLILTSYPESINMLPLHEYPCSGDLSHRQMVLAAIAEALPETFDITCRDDDDEYHSKLSKNLVKQFFFECKLSAWGQDVIWRLMKSSLNRKQQLLRNQKVESELIRSLRSENVQLEGAYMDISESLVKTRKELTESKELLQQAKDETEKHKRIARGQEAKYEEVTNKIRSLLETRKFNGESKVGVSNIDATNWSVAELKAILESLMDRLVSLLPTDDDVKLSMAHIAAIYLIKDSSAPSKDHLVDIIEALQKELTEL